MRTTGAHADFEEFKKADHTFLLYKSMTTDTLTARNSTPLGGAVEQRDAVEVRKLVDDSFDSRIIIAGSQAESRRARTSLA